MNALVDILVPIALGGVLPVMLFWLFIRQRMNETNKRTQIIMAAIEKNPEMDIEEFIKKTEPKQKLLKEMLLTKLLWGCIISFCGALIIGSGFYIIVNDLGGTSDAPGFIILGSIILAIGISFLINFAVGKKLLSREIEAEEKALTTKD